MNVVALYPQQRPTIPEMLLARQQLGVNSKDRLNLASRIAWNKSRMQNMTLCVGPGTPASVCMVKSASNSQSSDASSVASESEEEKVDDDEEEDEHFRYVDSPNQEEDMGDDDSDSDFAGRPGWMRGRYDDNEHSASRLAERTLMEWMDSDGDSEDDEDDVLDPATSLRFLPSLRHGGCINTATWLTSPWRLSLCGRTNGDVSTVPSEDCPTQLITSGDDRLVKFWDVRHAIGTSNPLAGGKSTVCPFSSEVPDEPPTDEWKEYQSKSSVPLSGSVVPLATLHTRHHGNVFHVTPLDHDPGKVVTCGADGYLRCGDLSSGTSSIIVSPEFDRHERDVAGFMSLRPGMCFSHHFVDAHTGLLCSERGLRRFDIRLSAREQNMRSVLTSDTCKACAFWSKESVDSAYIFAGGASADVGLYDLRMVSDGGPPSKMVQLYRPRDLTETSLVSVSGIDISRNKKELLVSYENDQIYSFPICPNAANASGPTVDELSEMSDQMEEQETVQHELCAYGGHLNRYTFLKNAKYAGPNDEYICTGSDSGHAWVYDKFSGSVVSFLNADHSTCNGVIPHPTLPVFVTYGIDSTAKLWRATVPVDRDIDDSPLGRASFYQGHESYNRSPLVSSWSYCKGKLSELNDIEEDGLSSLFVMPDEVPSTAEASDRGLFGGLSSIFFRNRRGGSASGGGPFIGNDLPNLSQVLRQNLFACILAYGGDDDEPVRSSINKLRSRMSSMRLHMQAQQRGLLVNPSIPWQLKRREWAKASPSSMSFSAKSQLSLEYCDPADLVPESPSDWIPFDPFMCKKPLPCGPLFNLEDYESFFNKYYFAEINTIHNTEDCEDGISTPPMTPQRNKRKLEVEEDEALKDATHVVSSGSLSSVLVNAVSSKSEKGTVVSTPSLLSSDDEDDTHNVTRAWQVLTDTVSLLKESGNKALKAKLPSLAARRYDQAIQYCAVAFLQFPLSKQDIFMARRKGDHRYEWSQLLKLLITTRLNLSMVMLKLAEPEPKKAADMALMALRELGPFVMEKGKVRKGRKLSEVHKDDEPESTFNDAKELQAKAFFRLGSAQLDIGEYSHATKSFDASIKSTKDIGGEPETILFRRLAEAKRSHARRNKKHRKKLRTMFGVEQEQQTATDDGHTFDFIQPSSAEGAQAEPGDDQNRSA